MVIEACVMALLYDVEVETLQMIRIWKGCKSPSSNTFSEGCRNPSNLQVCGLRQPPTMQKTLQIQYMQIPRVHAGMLQNAGFGTIQGGEPRTRIIYNTYMIILQCICIDASLKIREAAHIRNRNG